MKKIIVFISVFFCIFLFSPFIYWLFIAIGYKELSNVNDIYGVYYYENDEFKEVLFLNQNYTYDQKINIKKDNIYVENSGHWKFKRTHISLKNIIPITDGHNDNINPNWKDKRDSSFPICKLYGYVVIEFADGFFYKKIRN